MPSRTVVGQLATQDHQVDQVDPRQRSKSDLDGAMYSDLDLLDSCAIEVFSSSSSPDRSSNVISEAWVSTLFQPNFGVFGIDLSGGGCWGLPMSNRYSHPSSEKM